MPTSMALSVCVLLLVSHMAPRAHATLDAGILTDTSSYILANVNKAHTTAISCGGSSAFSRNGGSASAGTSSNASAYNVAASACASAVVKAYNDYNFTCAHSDVTSFISTAATACARATLALRTGSLAAAASRGRARAYASACSTATGFSSSCAKSIAHGLSKVFADNGLACGAYTSASNDAKVTAAAKAIADGLASSFAYAATHGNGDSQAESTALFTADVAAYAQAITKLFSIGCANCKPLGCSKFCTQLPDGDKSSSGTSALAAKGRFALASAFSDAVSAVCNQGITVQAATEACLKAIGDVCVQMYASVTGKAKASGRGVACTNSFVYGKATALSEAYASLVSEAAATAFKGDECASKAFASVSASGSVNISTEQVAKAFQKACVSANGGTVTYYAVSAALDWSANSDLSNAISDAIGSVESDCECSGAGYCCNCEDRSPTCPY